MQKRAVRVMLFALLVGSGVAAGFYLWDLERRLLAFEDERREVETLVEHMAPAIAGVGAAQQAYADYGQRDDAIFARVSALLESIAQDAAHLRTSDRSANAATPSHLEEFWTALSTLRAADSQARARLAAGETLAAADILFGSSRQQLTTLESQLRAFRDREFQYYRTQRTTLRSSSVVALAAVAAVWFLGVLALVPVPGRGKTKPEPEARAVPPVQVAPSVQPVQPARPVVERRSVEPVPAVPDVDLAAAADVCGAIARLADTTSIPEILARAATVIDARGIIVWMGAGDELFAAAAFGYEPSVVSRLRPIARTADNATAAAWRSGGLHSVKHDGASLGAIVAPMTGPGGCVGVIAAEVRNGREDNASTRAVTEMIAAQLASVLSAWPSASATDATDADSPAAIPLPSESDRQTAAS